MIGAKINAADKGTDDAVDGNYFAMQAPKYIDSQPEKSRSWI